MGQGGRRFRLVWGWLLRQLKGVCTRKKRWHGRYWNVIVSCLLLVLVYQVVFSSTVGLETSLLSRRSYMRVGEEQRIGIVTVASKAYQKDYQRQSRSVRCYADRHEYAYLLLSGEEYPSCSMLYGFYTRKLCTVLQVMRQYSNIEVLSVQDIDIAVVQPERRVEDYLSQVDRSGIYDLLLLDRHTGEWAAGIYIVRNTAWARDFLAAWIRTLGEQGTGFRNSLRNAWRKGCFSWYGNADNGALHLTMLRLLLLRDNETSETCEQLRRDATNSEEYAEFVRCVRTTCNELIAKRAAPVHFVPMQASYTVEAFFSREHKRSRFVYTFRNHSRLIMVHGVKSKYEDEFFAPEDPSQACSGVQVKSSVKRVEGGIHRWNAFFKKEIHEAYGHYMTWRKVKERGSGVSLG